MYSEPIDKIANNVPVASIFVWRLDLSAGKKRKCKLGIFFCQCWNGMFGWGHYWAYYDIIRNNASIIKSVFTFQNTEDENYEPLVENHQQDLVVVELEAFAGSWSGCRSQWTLFLNVFEWEENILLNKYWYCTKLFCHLVCFHDSKCWTLIMAHFGTIHHHSLCVTKPPYELQRPNLRSMKNRVHRDAPPLCCAISVAQMEIAMMRSTTLQHLNSMMFVSFPDERLNSKLFEGWESRNMNRQKI